MPNSFNVHKSLENEYWKYTWRISSLTNEWKQEFTMHINK